MIAALTWPEVLGYAFCVCALLVFAILAANHPQL